MLSCSLMESMEVSVQHTLLLIFSNIYLMPALEVQQILQ